MILLIDVGNSRIKWCLHDNVGNEFGLEGVMHHDKSDMPRLFSEHWSHLDSPERIVISNVSGQHLVESMDAWVEKAWQIKTEYVKTEAISYGVSNAYSDYTKLGVDRWMAIIAAWQKFRQEEKPICVVDCGTATTIDGISASGQHLGGFIIPGYTIMQEILLSNTSDIEMAGKVLPSISFSRSTEGGVHSGCYLAMISIIDRVLTSMQEDYGEKVNCIITGGNAEFVVGQLAGRFEYEPMLVLHGLAIFSGRAQ